MAEKFSIKDNMRIGLIDIEPKIFNTAYMQISHYHKSKGDTVEWWSPLTDGQFGHVYCSSIFDYTDKSEIPKRAICGGTGFDLTTKLPFDCRYDYSIYPKCDCSFVWFSRGCNRNCPFCIVREKEGALRPVKPKRKLNPNGTYIKVQDNNFFAGPKWHLALADLVIMGQPVDFAGGIDARILTETQCLALVRLKHHKQIKIAWDNPKEDLEPKLQDIIKIIKPYRLMCYVLIGYWSTPEEDLYRVETLRKLKIDPFVMPYNKKDPYQKAFARWVNHKACFASTSWKKYKYNY